MTSYLRNLWPKARKALEFCWIRGGWDADRDGVMEGAQHNTMDVEYYGPNPQMGFWYLGALRACEEMATYLGKCEFASECRRLFESGSRWIDDNLFNGEYYEQEIRLPAGDGFVAEGLIGGYGGAAKEPVFQLGSGCLIDQLVGQYMAHICGLGYLANRENLVATLKSLMKYNFKTELWSQFNHMRTFALQDESGMVMATYPRGNRPDKPFPYFNEVMTGFEYTAAVGMLYEGMIDEGLTVIDSIRKRFDGKRRSPFDETECGHHYARAMASWSAVLALSGFHYSGVTKTMSFAASATPMRGFWSNGRAWGTYSQMPRDYEGSKHPAKLTVSVLFGVLAVRTLAVAGVGSQSFDSDQTLERGNPITVTLTPS